MDLTTVLTALFTPAVCIALIIYIWTKLNKEITEMKVTIKEDKKENNEKIEKLDEKLEDVVTNYKTEFKLVKEKIHENSECNLKQHAEIQVSLAEIKTRIEFLIEQAKK